MTLEVDFSALLQEVAEHPTPDNVGAAFAAALDRRENPERYPHKPLSVVVCPHCDTQRWDGQGPCGVCGLLLDEPVTYTDEIGKMVIEAAERDDAPRATAPGVEAKAEDRAGTHPRGSAAVVDNTTPPAPPTAAAALLPPRHTSLDLAIGYPDPPPPTPPLDSQPETAAEAGPVPSESRLAAAPSTVAPPPTGSVPSPGQKPSALSGEGYSAPTDNGDGAFASQVATALERLAPQAGQELAAHQIPPPEHEDVNSDVKGWIMLAGRDSGKTYAGSRWLHRMMSHPGKPKRARIIAPTFSDAVAACVEGPSGILQASNYQVQWKPSHPGGAQLQWPNGSVCYVIGTPTPREVDRLRAVGNMDYDWFEEAAANTQLVEVERQARLSRRRPGSKWICTTTPRPLKTIREWTKDPTVRVSRATSHDNKHGDPMWRAELEKIYKGTRLYRQEVLGEILDDVEGALWSIGDLDRSRIPDLAAFYEMLAETGRVVAKAAVGVDPANSTGTTGIISVLISDDRHLYVVRDSSEPGRSAEKWARVAVDDASEWSGVVVPENDSGGDAIRAVLKAADLQDEVTIMPATARGRGGKGTRAEPIALLWEREDFRGHLVGSFPLLEDQLTTFVPDAPGQDSPDRLDAMVWACTYLWSRASFGDVTSSWPNSAYGKPGAVQMRRPGEVLPWRRPHKSRKETA